MKDGYVRKYIQYVTYVFFYIVYHWALSDLVEDSVIVLLIQI